ncbi:hypothetical protein AVEN_173616-1 [Araneus ventricosus]|uniref:Uncharacterized protein n=1 Tax=Araneus ventricosus TaxID=182803 RepID=A0A4Y2CR56_ARAVE|nr:hypothetical protein AVEN_173616-1 [Araneus ventricosus]
MPSEKRGVPGNKFNRSPSSSSISFPPQKERDASRAEIERPIPPEGETIDRSCRYWAGDNRKRTIRLYLLIMIRFFWKSPVGAGDGFDPGGHEMRR